MSKRNLILLIIILLVVALVAFIFMYFYQPANQNKNALEKGVDFFADFMPFGKSENITEEENTNNPTDVSGIEIGSENENTNSRLQRISSFPEAGYTLFIKERFKEIPDIDEVTNTERVTEEGTEENITPVAPPTETVDALRYVNKSTGNIYQTFLDKNDERIFSSTTIPRVYEAYFANNGSSVVMRYLKTDNKTIETFMGTLPKEILGEDRTSSNTLQGIFLPEDITDISISKDGQDLFYIFNSGNNSVGVTLNTSTNAKTQVFDSAFTEWLSWWPNNNMITMTTKPSYLVPGYMYSIDPSKKDFRKVIGGVNGLTTLTSPNGELVLYADNNLNLNIFNITTGVKSSISLRTMPEKCVWGLASDIVYCAVPNFIDRGNYPDAWYQGLVSFSDEIWKIDTYSLNTTLVSSIYNEEGSESIDAIKLSLDKEQKNLLFVNKKDDFLWRLRIE